MEQKKKGLHILGTKYGLFNGWFSSEYLKKINNSNPHYKNVEFSVR
jgi:hypothetical protein